MFMFSLFTINRRNGKNRINKVEILLVNLAIILAILYETGSSKYNLNISLINKIK